MSSGRLNPNGPIARSRRLDKVSVCDPAEHPIRRGFRQRLSREYGNFPGSRELGRQRIAAALIGTEFERLFAQDPSEIDIDSAAFDYGLDCMREVGIVDKLPVTRTG